MIKSSNISILMRRCMVYAMLFFCSSVSGQELKSYSPVEADSLSQIDSRDIVIFFHAEWCKFCENMLENGFVKEPTVNLLNNEFYFVPFDVEKNDKPMKFRGRNFQASHDLETSEFLSAFTHGRKIGLPYLVILNPKNDVIFEYDGFLNPTEITQVLNTVLE